jgi:ABC-type antimicrobial peptide transport system ATPase subunit
MNELRGNKSFQFICGVGTLALLFFMWENNVFSFLLDDEPSEGMESVSLATLVLTSVVSAVQFVGIISILIVSNVLKPLAEWTVDAVRARFPKVDAVADRIEDAIDVEKLTSVLNDLDERLRKVEATEDD